MGPPLTFNNNIVDCYCKSPTSALFNDDLGMLEFTLFLLENVKSHNQNLRPQRWIMFHLHNLFILQKIKYCIPKTLSFHDDVPSNGCLYDEWGSLDFTSHGLIESKVDPP